jgi:hypothetical protein
MAELLVTPEGDRRLIAGRPREPSSATLSRLSESLRYEITLKHTIGSSERHRCPCVHPGNRSQNHRRRARSHHRSPDTCEGMSRELPVRRSNGDGSLNFSAARLPSNRRPGVGGGSAPDVGHQPVTPPPRRVGGFFTFSAL